MPRYFFHVSNGRCAPDQDGIELVDETAARREALRRAIMFVNVTKGRPERVRDWRIDVSDYTGTVIFWVGANGGVVVPLN